MVFLFGGTPFLFYIKVYFYKGRSAGLTFQTNAPNVFLENF